MSIKNVFSLKNVFRLLVLLKKDSALFQKENVEYLTGLTKSKTKELKKYALEKGLIHERKKEYFLSEEGEKFLSQDFDEETKNWLRTGFQKSYSKTPIIINDALTLEKAPPTLTRAIRLLARHLIEGEELKENSNEHYLVKELLCSKSSCAQIKSEMEDFILNNGKINLSSFFEKFMNVPYGLTKSIAAVLLLEILVKNKDILAIYEQHQFQLRLNALMFDRMIYCPHNFDIQKTVMDEMPALKEMSKIILPCASSNILDLTKGLIHFVKNLEKYTLSTERLSKKTLRFRNVVLNAKDPISLFSRDIPKILSNCTLDKSDEIFLKEFENSIKELQTCYKNLIKEIKEFLLNSFFEADRKNLSLRFDRVKDFLAQSELKILHNNINNECSDEKLWIERIATFINKSRVPKDWSDEDVADFKFKIKEFALKFSTIETVAQTNDFCDKDKDLKNILKELSSLSRAQKNSILLHLSKS